ncbi:MAG: hypothetical protein EOM34_05985 [Clostridia bacterium]|nr:hypothetical protein [Lachnospiraceae bacterium]NCC00213.1 hypothetical protein [Clostridia bacterium]NCD03315.1 hypothetical protein [Clostridia bacterium]
MKWKKNVKVVREKGLELKSSEGVQAIISSDEYIVNAMESGIEEDEKLIEFIMETEQVNEIAARFRLAEFLITYGNYIEELSEELMIES